MKSDRAIPVLGVGFFLMCLALSGGCVAGYVMNIIQLISCDFTEVDAKEVLKIVGTVVLPIGAIMGWIG